MTDLATLLKSAKPGDTINVPRSTYSLASSALLTVAGVKLFGNGSTILAPSAGPVFKALAASVGVDGFNVAKFGVFFEAAADKASVSNCILGMGMPAGCVAQAVMTEGGGTNCVATNIQCLCPTSTVTFYGCYDGFQLIGCIGNSYAEAAARWDCSPMGVVPKNMLVRGGSYSNRGNLYGKQTLELREGSGSLIAVIIDGDMVTGQGTPSNPPQTPGQLGTVAIQGCTFQNRTPGNIFLGVRFGSKVSIDKATKFIDPQPTSKTVVVSGGQVIWT